MVDVVVIFLQQRRKFYVDACHVKFLQNNFAKQFGVYHGHIKICKKIREEVHNMAAKKKAKRKAAPKKRKAGKKRR